MRAALITEPGAPPILGERDDPQGDVVYTVTAVALNPIDLNVAAGRHYAGPPGFPYVPGCEGVGRDPDGGRAYLFGDGFGIGRDGLLAERAAAPRGLGIPLPDGVSDEVAVSCGIAGMAGWMPLAWRAPVTATDRVLVLGATGTAGLVAVQAAKLLGAELVVAAGRNEHRLERARELGADTTVNLGAGDLVESFTDATGGGPTLIVDVVWGEPAVAAIAAAAPGWRLVQVGQSASPEAAIASGPIRGKMGEIYGYTDFAVPPDVYRREYLRLVGHAAALQVLFDIESYALERLPEAWERQANGAAAKLVVTL